MFRVFQAFLPLLLLHYVASDVFVHRQDASQVLSRRRRANSPFEEWRQGNMERECVEERCDKEEAREIFEDDEKTNEFWTVYFDDDACLSQPCVNNGICKDAIGPYTCYCPEGFQGYNCEIVIPELCENKNGGCEQFCNIRQNSVACSCLKGYQLASDGKSCRSDDPYKCGHVYPKNTRRLFIYQPQGNATQNDNFTTTTTATTATATTETNAVNAKPVLNATRISVHDPWDDDLFDPIIEEVILPESVGNTRIVNGEECPPGECPWQALLKNEDKVGFCGGTILNEYFILSAAHCMNQSRSMTIVLGKFDMKVQEENEREYAVEQVLVHSNYIAETYHNDIALIKVKEPIIFTKYIIPACLPEHNFAEHVLMRQEDAMVSGFGRVREGGPQSTVLQKLTVPYVGRATCIEASQFKISTRMFCAGYDKEEKDACQGDSGGPHVTRYKGTWFVTGVVSWGEGCARKGKYGVYTQVSKYIKWIQNVMIQFMPKKADAGGSRKRMRKREAGPTVLWV